jgi:hypothetical protein
MGCVRVLGPSDNRLERDKNMSKMRGLQVLVALVVSALLLVLSGTTWAQGNRDNAFERVKEVQERHTEKLMTQAGIVGTAIGLDESGQYAVLVLLEKPGVAGVPADLEGVRVRPVVTGKIYARVKPVGSSGKPGGSSGKPGGSGTTPAAPSELQAQAVNYTQINLSWFDSSSNETGFRIERKSTGNFALIATVGANTSKYNDSGLACLTTYTYRVYAYNKSGNSAYSNEEGATTLTRYCERPVPIGVSTGHPLVTAGTIGCRVKDASGNVYALSNNHVYANENRATKRVDRVLQPGTFDQGVDPTDAIGTLYDFSYISFSRTASNTIDAAIALSSTQDLGNSTPVVLQGYPRGYGTPSHVCVTAYVGQAVQKYGRTTGLTKGTVYAINAAVNVGYSTGTARFVNQIVITPGTFSAGGDSGSLIVTQNSNNPVGLLFAGSSSYTIANPIGDVLTYFHVTVDGQ